MAHGFQLRLLAALNAEECDELGTETQKSADLHISPEEDANLVKRACGACIFPASRAGPELSWSPGPGSETSVSRKTGDQIHFDHHT